jgi:hypothetical protein
MQNTAFNLGGAATLTRVEKWAGPGKAEFEYYK